MGTTALESRRDVGQGHSPGPLSGLVRWGDALEQHSRPALQGHDAGEALESDREKYGQVPFGARVSSNKLGSKGGGLFFFPPKSFIGKHFISHLQLCVCFVAKQSRWVYEGSELKAFRIPTKYFSINFIVLSWGRGCEYSVAPWWVGASYSVWVH